jgi:hypothetical protein
VYTDGTAAQNSTNVLSVQRGSHPSHTKHIEEAVVYTSFIPPIVFTRYDATDKTAQHPH